MPKYVYDFAEGNRDMKDLLGGKGANLAEMTNLGIPVPPGFTVSTEACKVYLDSGTEPAELRDEVSEHLAHLEKVMAVLCPGSVTYCYASVRTAAQARQSPGATSLL